MIPGLDGLRAIAFLLVLGAHTNKTEFGWAGVQLFFVLSGFLLTGILLRMKDVFSGRQYFFKFYGRRFLRIFPLYFLYLFLLAIAVWQQNWISWGLLREQLQEKVQPQLLFSFLYLYDFVHASAIFQNTRFLTHLWSLSVEEQFYIFWPLVLFVTPRKKIRFLFLSIIIAGPFLRLLAYLAYSNHLFPSMLDNPYLAVYVLPFSHIDAFAMGAFISCYQLPKPRKQLAILIAVVPLMGFLAQYLGTGGIQPDSMGYEFMMFTSYKFVWGYTLLNYFFALIIQEVHQTGLFTRALDHFSLRYLGRISYGMYVFHFPIIWFLLAIQMEYKDRFPFTFYLGQTRTFFLVLIVTLAAASLSYHFFEKPINNLKDRFFSLKSP
jgi:peptidoglycan/LPS O-acetylase OafA/YrhL